jgi:hypothetical protein
MSNSEEIILISAFHNKKKFLELFGNNDYQIMIVVENNHIQFIERNILNDIKYGNIEEIICPLEIEESLFKFILIIQNKLKYFMKLVQNGYQIIDYLMNHLERNITEFWISSDEIIGYSFFKNIRDNNRYNDDIKIISYEGDDLKIKIYDENNEEGLTLQELNILFEYNPERGVYCF